MEPEGPEHLLVLTTECLDFTGSGLWNARTRGSCCIGQGWMAPEDVPSSVKAAILRGRTRKFFCWEVEDEGAGERLKSCHFFSWCTVNTAVPATCQDSIYSRTHGLCPAFPRTSLTAEENVSWVRNKQEAMFSCTV